MNGVVESIFRHPVKGLTPESMQQVQLSAGAYFPGDRNYAIEVGPSGFDAAAPKHISKQKFTVLARFPSLARVKTRLDDPTGRFHVGDASGVGVDTPAEPDGHPHTDDACPPVGTANRGGLALDLKTCRHTQTHISDLLAGPTVYPVNTVWRVPPSGESIHL